MFKIDHVGIRPKDSKAAQELLVAMGAILWGYDNPNAEGTVYGIRGSHSSEVCSNYTLAPESVELQILDYLSGPNWLANKQGSIVAYFGMNTDEDSLQGWKVFFKERDIPIVQEVHTTSHTRPLLVKYNRRHHYCIFGTRDILGIDIMFTVRSTVDE